MHDDDDSYSSDAVAGIVWGLCHILGVRPDQVHTMTITPHAGVIRAEVFTGETEQSPYGPVGSKRKAARLTAWTYRTPEAIALEIVTGPADAASRAPL